MTDMKNTIKFEADFFFPFCLCLLVFFVVSFCTFWFFFSDVNECETGVDDCDVNANCSNAEGSYRCLCKTGFEGNGTTCQGTGTVKTNRRAVRLQYLE